MVEQIKAKCPNCGIELEDIPKRKKKCQHCGKYIYIKTKKNIFDSMLLTKEEKLASEEIYKLSGQFNLRMYDYRNKEKDLTERFGGKPPPTDVIWGIYQDLITKHVSDFWSLHLLYYNQAQFLFKEGKDSQQMMKLSLKMNLMALKSEGIKTVEIYTEKVNHPEHCKKLNGIVISIDEALRTMPLPVDECPRLMYNKDKGFCRCSYISVTTINAVKPKAYKIKRPMEKKRFSLWKR